MPQLERVTFDSPADRQVYKQVEQYGPRQVDEVRTATSLSEEEFRAALDRLLDRGYLRRSGDTLGVDLDLGGSEAHETQDFAYTIRPARADDLDALIDVVEAIAGKKTYVVAKQLAAELQYDDTVVRYTSSEARVVFVAVVDDEIVGWSHLDLPLVENLRSTARLTVGLREAYRGYGVATTLLNRALDWAEAHGYRKVYNNVARTNMQAISFLEARDWEREGVRENHYTIGHKQVDEVMMAYTF